MREMRDIERDRERGWGKAGETTRERQGPTERYREREEGVRQER